MRNDNFGFGKGSLNPTIRSMRIGWPNPKKVWKTNVDWIGLNFLAPEQPWDERD